MYNTIRLFATDGGRQVTAGITQLLQPNNCLWCFSSQK